jgi:hypothetical protein
LSARNNANCLASWRSPSSGRYNGVMMMSTDSPISLKRGKAMASALTRVLGLRHDAVRELVSNETGARRASARQMLSWMRVHMPSAADLVDDVLCPQPFKD